MIDAKVLQLEVAIGVIVAVGADGEIVRSDRSSAIRETRALGRMEEFPEHRLPVLLVERVERGPAEFVETGAKALDRWAGTAC